MDVMGFQPAVSFSVSRAKGSRAVCSRQMLVCVIERTDVGPELRPGTRVVVSGGTGFIGSALVRRLATSQANVVVLARSERKARECFGNLPVEVVSYDAADSGPLSEAVSAALSTADAVVNLAGEPVESGRWTPKRKTVLWDSRVKGTARIARALSSSSFHGVFISASAVGFYGSSSERRFTEGDPAGKDFLARLAYAWERAGLRHVGSNGSIRNVVLRIGVVLGGDGGALSKLTPAFKAFLGGPAGSGKQWFSWVHLDDVVSVIVRCIVNESFSGTYNTTAPKPVRLSELCDTLGQVLGKPSWLRVPGVAVKFALGSEAADLILSGQRVCSTRLEECGFIFKYPTIGPALRSIYRSE